MAEVRAHVLAHKAAVDTVRNELEKAKEQELEALRQQCDADLGTSCLLMLLTGRVKTIISHHTDASYAALDVHLINYIVFQKTTCICFPACFQLLLGQILSNFNNFGIYISRRMLLYNDSSIPTSLCFCFYTTCDIKILNLTRHSATYFANHTSINTSSLLINESFQFS